MPRLYGPPNPTPVTEVKYYDRPGSYWFTLEDKGQEIMSSRIFATKAMRGIWARKAKVAINRIGAGSKA